MAQTNDELMTVVLKPQKLIFCDIDGTLIDDRNEVHDESLQALRKLINERPDFHFALASGRSLADELIIYKKLGLKNTGLLIGNNGAQIYALKNHKMVKEVFIPEEIAQAMYEELMQIAKQNKRLLFMVTYSNSSNFIYNLPTDLYKNFHLCDVKIKENFDNQKIVNFSILFLNEERERFVKKYQTHNLHIIDGPVLTAVGGEKVSKEDAIQWVANHYNIALNNIAVIGDSRNDIGMFSLPNVYSITYAGAKSYLKNLAKLVIDKPKSIFIKDAVIAFEEYIQKQETNKF